MLEIDTAVDNAQHHSRAVVSLIEPLPLGIG